MEFLLFILHIVNMILFLNTSAIYAPVYFNVNLMFTAADIGRLVQELICHSSFFGFPLFFFKIKADHLGVHKVKVDPCTCLLKTFLVEMELWALRLVLLFSV